MDCLSPDSGIPNHSLPISSKATTTFSRRRRQYLAGSQIRNSELCPDHQQEAPRRSACHRVCRGTAQCTDNTKGGRSSGPCEWSPLLLAPLAPFRYRQIDKTPWTLNGADATRKKEQWRKWKKKRGQGTKGDAKATKRKRMKQKDGLPQNVIKTGKGSKRCLYW